MNRLTKTLLSGAAILIIVAGTTLLIQTRQGGDPRPALFPFTITDDEGVVLTLSSPPARIATLAPYLTETVFALGRAEALVGVSGGETHPLAALTLPALVEADGISPDPAKISETAPDLVLAGHGGPEWKAAVREAGIPLVTMAPSSVEDAIASIRMLGAALGASGEGEHLASQLEAEVQETAARVAERPPPRVFVESFYPPFLAAGTGGFVADLLARAGGSLVGPDQQDTAPWTPEQVEALGLDVYIVPSSSATSPQELASRPGFGALTVIAQGRVHVIDDDLLFRPGPRLGRGIAELARILHPDAFPAG